MPFFSSPETFCSFFSIWLECFLTLLWCIGSACIWKWKLRKCSSPKVLIKFLPTTAPTHKVATCGMGPPSRWPGHKWGRSTLENNCYIKCGSSAQGVFSRPFALRINWLGYELIGPYPGMFWAGNGQILWPITSLWLIIGLVRVLYLPKSPTIWSELKVHQMSNTWQLCWACGLNLQLSLNFEAWWLNGLKSTLWTFERPSLYRPSVTALK